MTRKQFIREFRKFYIHNINNSRKQKDIIYREYLIERILDRALWICYEINNGELVERYSLECEFNFLINEFLEDDDSEYLKNAYDLINIHLLKK